MKVLFLDFDGVINSDEFFTRVNDNTFMPSMDKIDPDAVKILNAIVEGSGAKVVISSSWRKGFGINVLRDMLEQVGFVGDVIDITPRFLSYMARGFEIKRWLEAYYAELRDGPATEPIEAIVCLDDADDMLTMKPWTVATTWEKGLQPEHVQQALDILKLAPWTDKPIERSPEND